MQFYGKFGSQSVSLEFIARKKEPKIPYFKRVFRHTPVGGAIFESLPALKVYILMFEMAVKLPEKLLVAARNRGEIGVSQEGTLGVPSCSHLLSFTRQSVHFRRQD